MSSEELVTQLEVDRVAVRIMTQEIMHPISFNDPASWGYPHARPGEVVDLVSQGRRVECEIELTPKQAVEISRSLVPGVQISIKAEGCRLTGEFYLEIVGEGLSNGGLSGQKLRPDSLRYVLRGVCSEWAVEG